MNLYQALHDGEEVYSVQCINNGMFTPIRGFKKPKAEPTSVGDVSVTLRADSLLEALAVVLQIINKREAQ